MQDSGQDSLSSFPILVQEDPFKRKAAAKKQRHISRPTIRKLHTSHTYEIKDNHERGSHGRMQHIGKYQGRQQEGARAKGMDRAQKKQAELLGDPGWVGANPSVLEKQYRSTPLHYFWLDWYTPNWKVQG